MQTIFEFIELVLWIITLIGLVIVNVYCVQVWRKDEKTYFLGLFCLFFLFLLGLICSLINTYFFGFNNTSMTSSYLLFNPIWLLLRSLFLIFTMSGLIIFHYTLNKEVVNTKGVFIPIQVVIMIIVIINYLIPQELVFYIFLLSLTFFSLPGIYFYLAIKLVGYLRTNSFLIGLGTFCIVIGILLALPETWVFTYTLNIISVPASLPIFSLGLKIQAPIMITVGLFLCIFGEERSRSKE